MGDPTTAQRPAADSGAPILRFRRSERAMHWAIAVPFMVCWSTAMILINVYNGAPDRPLRALFSWTHRISGVALALLPFLAAVYYRRDYRIHLHNVKQAWCWGLSDIRWMIVMGLKAVFPRLQLPEAGKFNAGEKLNFMVGMMVLPVFVVSGFLVWLPGVAFVAWLFHFYLGILITPLMLGHIYMATVNRDTRAGLSGMFSGFVDRSWARHHYGRWFREATGTSPGQVATAPADAPAELVLRCWFCARTARLLQERVSERAARGEAVPCPTCGHALDVPAYRVVGTAPDAPLSAHGAEPEDGAERKPSSQSPTATPGSS